LIDIGLNAIPNQSLTIQIDDDLYQITMKATRGVMSCSIVRNDVAIVSNVRVVPGSPIIPYKYLESGNFVLLTQNDDYPEYTKFGSSQSLVFVSQLEIDELRNAGT
jgi:tRNA(Ile2) C34 agmatinyltransferase TiaS